MENTFQSNLTVLSMAREEKYRKNVLGVIFDQDNNVLIVSRANDPLHWQFPQGGIDEHETEEAAIMRELSEELGTTSFHITDICPEKHCYRWARNLIRDEHVGQEQTIFLMKFTGNTSEIRVDKRELGGFLWVPADKVEIFLHSYRKPVWDIVKKYY